MYGVTRESFMDRFCPSVSMEVTMNETVAERQIYYRLGDSEMFQFANANTKIGGMKLIDLLPRMTVPNQGFVHLDYSMFDSTLKYELFESNRYKISCKRAMRQLIENGSVVPVYSEEYKLPTSIPFIIQSIGSKHKVFVNVSDFVTMNQYGKIIVEQTRNYNALMAVLFSACVALRITDSTTSTLPADIADSMVMTYANMLERVIQFIISMDPITRDKVRYLATKFALIQMYGTVKGENMFLRYRSKYFPKLSNMIMDSMDDQFKLDHFDKLSLFIEELRRLYPAMRNLTDYTVYDKWIRSYGAATAMSIDYFGYHLYTICMVLFESPLVSRMALEPIMEKNKGTELYRRLPQLIEP